MFCPNCGTKNDNAARFCGSCGTSLAPAAAARATSGAPPASAVSGAAEAVANVVSGAAGAAAGVAAVAPAAIKSRARIIVILVLLLAVLAAGTLGAKTVFARTFAELFASDENYARNYAVDRLGEISDDSLDAVATFFAANSNAGKSTSEVKISASLSESYIDDMLYDFDLYNYEAIAPLLYILGSSALTLESQTDFNEDDMAFSLAGDWLVKNRSILTASMTVTDNTVYLHAPELYADTFAFSFGDLGLGELTSPLDLMNMYRYQFGYYGFVPQDDSLTALAEHTAELKPMLRALIKAAADELPFDLDKKAVLNINGAQVKTHALTLDFSARDLSRATVAALELLREDDGYLELLSRLSRDFLAYYGMDSMNKSEIKQQIDDLIGELRYASSAETLGRLELYVDARNKPIGVFIGIEDGSKGSAYTTDSASYDPLSDDAATSFALAPLDAPDARNFAFTATESGYEAEILFAAVLGKGYECRYADSYSEYRLYGDLNGGVGSAKGTINLSYYDGYSDQEIDIPLGSFSGLTVKDYQGVKMPNFTWNFSIGDILGELALQDVLYADSVEQFNNITGELQYTASDKRIGMSLKFEDGRDANIAIESSSVINSGERNITPPSGRDVVYVRPYDLLYEIDEYELFDNVETIAETLDDMGFDAYDLFYNINESFQYLF
jgi:hypothetical protein